MTAEENSTMSQSELEANTCNQHQAREKRVRAIQDWREFSKQITEQTAKTIAKLVSTVDWKPH